jgi:hypothetical protein
MTQAAYQQTLQRIIDEFPNLSPETIKVLMFDKNGEVVAKTNSTPEDEKILINNFYEINLQAQEIIGEVENLTIHGSECQLNITIPNNGIYLATISSSAADQKSLKSLTHVLIPTVVRLFNQTSQDAAESQPTPAITLKDESSEESVFPVVVNAEEKQEFKPAVEPEMAQEFNPQTLQPCPPVTQFMVEKTRGLLVQSDTVRIDSETIQKWNCLFENKQITQVQIETLDSKTVTCKFKPIKEEKNSLKGIIQIPEKILQILQTSKGKLVMVKPIVE